MGIGDFFEKAWDWTSTTVKKAVSSVKDAAQQVWAGVKKAAGAAYDTGSRVVQTVGRLASRVGVTRPPVATQPVIKAVSPVVVQPPVTQVSVGNSVTGIAPSYSPAVEVSYADTVTDSLSQHRFILMLFKNHSMPCHRVCRGYPD